MGAPLLPAPIPRGSRIPPARRGAQERSRAARTQGSRRWPGGGRGALGELLHRSVSQQWMRTPGSSCCWQWREVAQPLVSRMPRTTAKQAQGGMSGDGHSGGDAVTAWNRGQALLGGCKVGFGGEERLEQPLQPRARGRTHRSLF